MHGFEREIAAGIVTVIVTVLAGLVLRRLEPRAKVVWWSTRPTVFQLLMPARTDNTGETAEIAAVKSSSAIALVKDENAAKSATPSTQTLGVATMSTFITNTGNKKAEDVEICHKRRPENFQLYPSHQYEEEYTPDGAHIIKIKSLGPKQGVAVEYLAMAMMPELNYIKAEDAMCETVQVLFQTKPSQLMVCLTNILLATGSLFLIICLATWLSIPLSNVLTGQLFHQMPSQSENKR